MSSGTAQSAACCVGFGVLLIAMLHVTTPGLAGVLDASWIAPTSNTDGSPLTDLASYRVYYGPSASPCPTSSFFQVAASTSSPGINQTEHFRLMGLTTGALYYVSVSAVDASGNQSACSSVASAVVRSEFAVNPTGTVNFGTVNLGGFSEKTFIVSNTGGGTISGTASVASPFSIASGSPFTLAGVGATEPVTVRFTPITTATASVNLAFTASGGSVSVIVTGMGSGTNTTSSAGTVISPTSSSTVNEPADTTAPVISKVRLSVTSSDATIGWTTNETSDTQVEYGLTDSYGSLTPLNTSLVTSHSQVISGLAPNTGYRFRMRSRDGAGNLAVSRDYKFRTRPR